MGYAKGYLECIFILDYVGVLQSFQYGDFLVDFLFADHRPLKLLDGHDFICADFSTCHKPQNTLEDLAERALSDAVFVVKGIFADPHNVFLLLVLHRPIYYITYIL